MTDGVLLAGAAFRAAVRLLRVVAALRPATRRLRVVAAFFAAVRRFRVTAAFRAADVPINQLRRLLSLVVPQSTHANQSTGRELQFVDVWE
jgi:hypothetical protein